jgi:nicotinamidase-related amidase
MLLLSVDLQNEFARAGGRLFRPRHCVPFLTDVVFPTAKSRQWPVYEIVSDYRDPAKPLQDCSCVPGTWGAESLVPRDLLAGEPWVKSAPSPAWTQLCGADPSGLSAWLLATLGPPCAELEVVVVGLMLEVCVLSTLQELKYRGYPLKILYDGVDTYSGNPDQKKALFDALFPFWATPVHWDELG